MSFCPGYVTKLVTSVSNGGLILLGALGGAKELGAGESEKEGLTGFSPTLVKDCPVCTAKQLHRQQRNTETKGRYPHAMQDSCCQLTSAHS